MMHFTPFFLVLAMIYGVAGSMSTTNIFHIHRGDGSGKVKLWYDPHSNMKTVPEMHYINENRMRIILSSSLDIDIFINDDYIFADTFSIYVNDHLQYVCFYDDDDHQNGDLFDIVMDEQTYTYRIMAGKHASCTAINN